MLNNRKLLTAKEVAQVLKFNVLTVYQYLRVNKLAAIKFGKNYRVDMMDLEKFIKKHRIKNTNNKENKKTGK